MDKLDLHSKAIELRKKLGEDSSSPIDIFSLVKTIENLTLVFYPMSDNISGVCVKNNDYPIIAINSTMSLGRQRFSLAHELYHLYYDNDTHLSVSQQVIGGSNDIEKEADCFASFFLLPEDALRSLLSELEEIPLTKIIYIEQLYGISRQAILYRLVSSKYMNKSEASKYNVNVIRSAKELGYDDTLYKPQPKEKLYMTYGNYINMATQLHESETISTGKYESLLLSAFRDDLVYGDTNEGGELND